MGLAVEKLGTVYEASTEVVDPDRAMAYAAATNDGNPAYESGKLAPPVFAVVPAWAALARAVADVVPPEAFLMLVHGEHDMHFHQPLVPGRSLTSAAEAHSLRVGRSGTRFTVLVRSTDAGTGEPVLDQYATLFIRGMTDGESGGPDAPDHAFPEDARGEPVAQHTVHVDDDQTFRYRDASGDHNPIHVDEAFARSVGLPGIIAHGLCTLAMVSQSVITTVADGDPARLRRLAARFSKPVFPGHDVETAIYGAGQAEGRRVYAYETTSQGQQVITHGRAEVDA